MATTTPVTSVYAAPNSVYANTLTRNGWVTLPYALFLHRFEMKRKRKHVMKLSQSKIRLTEYLIIKQKQRIANCTNEDLQCLARGQDFRNFLYNQIMHRQMQQRAAAAAARNPSIAIAAPTPTPTTVVAAPMQSTIVAAPMQSTIVALPNPAIYPPVAWSEPKIRTPACAVFMHRAELKRKRLHPFKVQQTKIYLTDHLVHKLRQHYGNCTVEDKQVMVREMRFRNHLNGNLLNCYKNMTNMHMKVLQKKLKRLQ